MVLGMPASWNLHITSLSICGWHYLPAPGALTASLPSPRSLDRRLRPGPPWAPGEPCGLGSFLGHTVLILAGVVAQEASSREQTACIWALGLTHRDPRPSLSLQLRRRGPVTIKSQSSYLIQKHWSLWGSWGLRESQVPFRRGEYRFAGTEFF